MNKLKDLIKEKTEVKKEDAPTPIPQKPKTPEVPEDVLRKILE